jgi:hypothetical protein
MIHTLITLLQQYSKWNWLPGQNMLIPPGPTSFERMELWAYGIRTELPWKFLREVDKAENEALVTSSRWMDYAPMDVTDIWEAQKSSTWYIYGSLLLWTWPDGKYLYQYFVALIRFKIPPISNSYFTRFLCQSQNYYLPPTKMQRQLLDEVEEILNLLSCHGYHWRVSSARLDHFYINPQSRTQRR